MTVVFFFFFQVAHQLRCLTKHTAFPRPTSCNGALWYEQNLTSVNRWFHIQVMIRLSILKSCPCKRNKPLRYKLLVFVSACWSPCPPPPCLLVLGFLGQNLSITGLLQPIRSTVYESSTTVGEEPAAKSNSYWSQSRKKQKHLYPSRKDFSALQFWCDRYYSSTNLLSKRHCCFQNNSGFLCWLRHLNNVSCRQQVPHRTQIGSTHSLKPGDEFASLGHDVIQVPRNVSDRPTQQMKGYSIIAQPYLETPTISTGAAAQWSISLSQHNKAISKHLPRDTGDLKVKGKLKKKTSKWKTGVTDQEIECPV